MKHKKDSKNCSCTILVARLSIAVLFLMGLVGKLTNFSFTQEMGLGSWVPLPGILLLIVAILMLLFGIATLILGWKMREGALVLALYTALATVMFHIGEGEMFNFIKNLAIFGGLLALSMLKPGKYSLDG